MMSSKTGKTKLLLPVLLVAVLAFASVAVAVPLAAFAQTTTDQENNNDGTTTAPEDNSTTTDQSDNSTDTTDQGTLTPEGTITGPTDNSTETTTTDQTGENNTETAPENTTATTTGTEEENGTTQITGTIKVNETQTADDFDTSILAIQPENASQVAAAQVTNGTVVNNQLDVVQGYLVYTITVADFANHDIFHVIVDPGDGSVLYSSPGIPVGNSSLQDMMDESGISSNGSSGGGGGGGNSDDGDDDGHHHHHHSH